MKYELQSQKQKSFYRKAMVDCWQDGTILLTSYDTIVLVVKDGKLYRTWDGYSATTMKHINEFLDQQGIAGGGKKWCDSLPVTDYSELIPRKTNNIKLIFPK